MLPLAYSLALRLSDTGIDDDLLCDYLRIDPDALPTLLERPDAKLNAAMNRPPTNHDSDNPLDR